MSKLHVERRLALVRAQPGLVLILAEDHGWMCSYCARGLQHAWTCCRIRHPHDGRCSLFRCGRYARSDLRIRLDYATVDHIVPVALGGGDLLDNLALACRDCNDAKGALTVGELPGSMAQTRRIWRLRQQALTAARPLSSAC